MNQKPGVVTPAQRVRHGAAASCPTMSLCLHTAEHLVGLRPAELRACAAVLRAAVATGTRIFTFGNGGSAATASHLACDLTGRGRGPTGRRARVRTLYDAATTTAIANDHGYDEVFCRLLDGDAEPDDVAVAISVSGRSRNVVRALEAARRGGVVTVGLLGGDGGAARPLCDVAVTVPCIDYGVVESVHLAVVSTETTGPATAGART